MKSKNWKQGNPPDQLIAIRFDYDESVFNFRSRLIDRDEFLKRTEAFLEEIGQLIPYLRNEQPWETFEIPESQLQST